MIQPALVRRCSGLALLLAAVAAGAALAAGSPRVAGGVAAGAILGLLPIVTWSLMGGLLFSARGPLLFGAISLGKLLLYASALALLIGRNLVDPLAFAAALLAPGLLFALFARTRATT
jgi:hypothetical protein